MIQIHPAFESVLPDLGVVKDELLERVSLNVEERRNQGTGLIVIDRQENKCCNN